MAFPFVIQSVEVRSRNSNSSSSNNNNNNNNNIGKVVTSNRPDIIIKNKKRKHAH